MNEKNVFKETIHAYESLWAAQLAGQHLSEADFKLWLAFNSVNKLHMRLHDDLVGWGWVDGAAAKLSSFKLKKINVTAQGVDYLFWDEWENPIHVGYTPTLLGDTETFVWVNHFNEFRHTPHDRENASLPGKLSVCLMVWQAGNPRKYRRPEHKYITTGYHFEQRWQGRKFKEANFDA